MPHVNGRDTSPLCGAKTRTNNGKPCRHIAGFRTDHLGVGKCYLHGGKTQSHKAHAVAVEARQRMSTMGEPVEAITAPDALMGLLRSSAGHVGWLQQEVAALDGLDAHEAAVLVRLYHEERSMLVRVSEACIRAGVAEHIVRMEQAQASMTLRAISDAAGDAGLSRRQRQALGVALRKRLAALSADPEAAAAEAEAANKRLAEIKAEIKAEDERRIERAAARRPPADATYPPSEWVAPEPDAA